MTLCGIVKVLLLLYTALTSAVSHVQQHVGLGAEGRECDELRREMMTVFQHAHEKKVWPNFLHKLIPEWIEFSLPANCSKLGNDMNNFSLSSNTDNGGPLRKFGTPRTIYSMSTHARGQRGTRQDFKNRQDGETILVREKRFLTAGLAAGVPDFGAMSLGSANPGPAGEVSESTQMMNSLLMFSKLQKSRLAREYATIGRQGGRYAGDFVSSSTGMYGDTYLGRRKRGAIATKGEAKVGSSSSEKSGSRKKRFLFGGELVEGPSLFSIMLGTATDPNTGKRIEFGGDVAKRALANTFSFFLPPGMQPPPGKEPGDFVKNMAPLFLTNFGSSAGTVKRQNRNGLFGDALPGRKRRKRSFEVASVGQLGFFENKGQYGF